MDLFPVYSVIGTVPHGHNGKAKTYTSFGHTFEFADDSMHGSCFACPWNSRDICITVHGRQEMYQSARGRKGRETHKRILRFPPPTVPLRSSTLY